MPHPTFKIRVSLRIDMVFLLNKLQFEDTKNRGTFVENINRELHSNKFFGVRKENVKAADFLNWTEERREDELEGRKKDMATGERIQRKDRETCGVEEREREY
jgi:hypothetical protein